MKQLNLQPVLLPTKDASHIGFDEDNKLHLAKEFGFEMFDTKKNFAHNPQHLYLTSNRETKHKEWIINGAGELTRAGRDLSFEEVNAFVIGGKIEFTTDPKLIEGGVPAINGNTKVKFEDPIHKGLKVTTDNFLPEFVERYNGEQKGVDVEKLAQQMSEKEFPYSDFQGKRVGIDDEHTGQALRGAYVGAFEDGFKANQALQDNDKMFSLEDIQFAIQFGINVESGNVKRDYSISSAKQFIQSITKEQEQPKEVEMYCEMEELPKGTMYGGVGGVSRKKYEEAMKPKIKLINGQPIIHFK